MVFWQRFLITFFVMVVASLIIAAVWQSVFNMTLPTYVAGVAAGLTALPVWELLKKFKPKKEKNLHSENF